MNSDFSKLKRYANNRYGNLSIIEEFNVRRYLKTSIRGFSKQYLKIFDMINNYKDSSNFVKYRLRVILFCIDTIYEVCINLFEIKRNKNKVIKFYYIRILCVVIYESMDNYNVLINKEYNDNLALCNKEQISNIIRDGLNDFKKLKKDCKDEIGLIRNTVGAHKTLNLDLYNKIMDSIDESSIVIFALTYVSILGHFADNNFAWIYNDMDIK
jgi:hypothetical protein